ncbi:MAG: T9SS type A sorting domain-containing protein [candidate division WOR-3 bacterium]|nr:T9SS type A sorting domain-containing protein [candidate division WOR-3 bacterium]
MRTWRWSILLLFAAAVAFGGRLSFQEHAAVQESLSRVHPRMRASWLRAHGLDDSYYTTFRRPESTGLACIGRWPWGPSWELAGRDTFVYLGSGSGVRILSIADSVQPRMLGQVNARGLVSQVVVQDSLLFVACGSWGAQVYSVADPANPRELGSMDAVISDLCVKDTFCYAVGGDSLRIYDVSNPALPRLAGAIRDSGDVIVQANGYAYVGCGSFGTGLNVYDVRSPHSPTLVNTLGGVQLALFVRGQLLFRTSVQPSYFSILDISVPTSIHEVGRIDGYGGHALYADDYFAYLSCSYDHDGIFVVDITNPADPQLRDSLNPDGTTNWDPYVPVALSYGYLASDYGGLVTVDIHNVNSISEAWSGYEACRSLDIDIDDGRANVANDESGLQIIDVTNPSNPNSLGIYDLVGAKTTTTVQVRDSFAFIGFWGSNRRFLRVLDVTDPASPTFAAEESCRNPLQDMVLRDSLLYCAEMNEFQVFNVARPREPVRVGSCGGVGINARNIALRDSVAYVAMGSGGLACISVSDPAAPSIVGSWGGRSSGVSLSDTIAYVAGPYTGLVSLSMADPSSPRMIDSLSLTDTLWWNDVAVSGSRAYVGGERVLTVDITNPANLTVRASVSPPYLAQRLAYSSPYLYAACLEAGVAIYETTAVGVAEQAPTRHRPATLHLRPGLTDGEVHFTLDVTARSTDIAVYDVSGKRLGNVRQQVTVKGGATEGVIDLSGLAAGVYVVKVEAERKSFTAKVVKTNRR